jgi:glycosyltransferase involved in cell wall biosynthesis
MHILYLSSSGGGLETNVRVLGPALLEAGHQASVLYLSRPPQANGHPLPSNDLQTYYAPVGNWHYYLHRATFGWTSLPLVVRSFEGARAFAQVVRSIHEQEPLDLVEVPEITLPFHDLPVPYVVRLHSSAWMCRRMYGDPEPRADRVAIGWEARTLRRAAAVSSPSQAVADYVRSVCDLRPLPVEIIPYPVDTSQFTPGLKSATPLVLFVGRVEKRKGADILLRALPRVLARHANCEFVFAGRVCEDMSELIGNAPSQTRFLGPVPRAELVQWYQRAWVSVTPSLWDNSPNTIYEAMSCGTPVVATRVGGIPELVDHGETGLLVHPRDERALAEATTALLDDRPQGEQMGKRGREKAVAEYGLDKIVAQTLGLYAQRCWEH